MLLIDPSGNDSLSIELDISRKHFLVFGNYIPLLFQEKNSSTISKQSDKMLRNWESSSIIWYLIWIFWILRTKLEKYFHVIFNHKNLGEKKFSRQKHSEQAANMIGSLTVGKFLMQKHVQQFLYLMYVISDINMFKTGHIRMFVNEGQRERERGNVRRKNLTWRIYSHKIFSNLIPKRLPWIIDRNSMMYYLFNGKYVWSWISCAYTVSNNLKSN